MTKGATADAGLGRTGTININYVDAPILLNLGIPTGTGVRPFFLIGPVFSAKVGTANTEVSGDTDESIDDDVTSNDIGLAIGAGIKIGKWIVEVRYNHGLKDVDSTHDSAKHRGLLILVDLRLGS